MMVGSYGSLARFRGISRLLKVNDKVAIGASGDYADFQYLQDVINQKVYVCQIMIYIHFILETLSNIYQGIVANRINVASKYHLFVAQN